MQWLYRLAIISEGDVDIPKPGLTDASITTVLQIVFGLLGGAAVIVLIIAGIQYSVSLGNPEATGKLRNTIIYAGVGLAISLAAFSIVTFVLDAII
jgi:hypothetical protein